MSDMTRALLPDNATTLEIELAAATKLLDAIDVSAITMLWDAARCPHALLPVLAWAMSVDVWDDRWEEARKRRAIAESRAYHEIKGTRDAVQRVLSLLGCRSVIEEWWQQIPPGRRGTFRVTAYATEILPSYPALVTPERLADTVKALHRAKPKSRAFTFEMRVGIEGDLGVAGVAQSHEFSFVHGSMAADTRVGGDLGVAAVLRALDAVAFRGGISSPALAAAPAMAGAINAIDFAAFDMRIS